MLRITFVTAAALLMLAGCAPEHKDYDASAKCQDLGNQPGTKAYDQCVSDEKTSELMQQQQQEFEDMKQQQQDWTLRRY